MILLVEYILCSALKNLFDNQPNIFDFTSKTGQTEWNLAHHLANEIHKYIFWLDHDLDVTKRNLENKRPDIIFHKRGINALNFLAVEIKREKGGSVKSDIDKIKGYWMGDGLRYRFGASVKMYDEYHRYDIVLLDQSNNVIKCSNDKYPKPIEIKKHSGVNVRRINKLMYDVFVLVKSEDYLQNYQKQTKVKKYKRQIDQMVYKLYGLTDEEIRIIEQSINYG